MSFNTVERDPNIVLGEALEPLLPEYALNEAKSKGIWTFMSHKSGDGRSFDIRFDGHSANRHYLVGANYPYYNGKTYRPGDGPESIKVALKRGVEALAKDIQRRLLPGYHEQFQIQRKLVEEAKEWDNGRHALRTRICEALHRRIPTHDEDSMQIRCYDFGVREISINGPDSVSVNTTSLPEHVALEIIGILKKHGLE